jgi:WD40 repeat protein
MATLPIFEPPYARNAAGILVDQTRVCHLVFSDEGDSLLAGCSDCTAKWWDLTTGRRVEVANLRRGNVDLVGFIDSGAHIVAGTSSSLTVWDRGTATQLLTVPLDRNAAWLHVSLAPRPHMVSLGSQGAMLLWNTETWTCHQSAVRLPNRKFPTAIAYSPLSDLLAIGFDHGTVLIWSPQEQAVVGRLKCSDYILSLAFSPVKPTLCVVNGAGENRITEYSYTLPDEHAAPRTVST